ncbi:FAD-dependent oxidoreductase [Solibacillus sp. CAU 1738]|uniref:FAD-dependent oxidoreductase n=1 Tax=Solibacillus sp. CAU 1738 TaxID=3140363 RepID=UPI00326045C1
MQQSLWLQHVTPLTTSTVTSDMTCDICIIGAGLSGIYTSYLLAKEGFNVVVVEAKAIGSGATVYSTGKLTAQHGALFHTLPEEHAKLYYHANKDAIEHALNTACNKTFIRATSFLYTTEQNKRIQLEQEHTAYEKIGIPSIATNDTELNVNVQLALGMKDEAQIHPVSFLLHFAKLAQKEGVQLFTNTRITHVTNDPTATTEDGYTITCDKLILCTHYPIESLSGLTTTKLTINRTYLTAVKTKELLNGQYLSIDSSSRTIRTALIEADPYFIYGGMSHAAGMESETAKYYDTLSKELETVYDLPAPSYLWSAQDMATPDKLPFVGPISKDSPIFITTGYNKWGLSNSLVAAEILRGIFTKNEHPATALYYPNRIKGRTIYEMLVQVGFIGEQFIGGHITRISAPKCTHLGCKTRWNTADETWDCPCHGSRYDKNGDVIEGPAVYPLDLKNSE